MSSNIIGVTIEVDDNGVITKGYPSPIGTKADRTAFQYDGTDADAISTQAGFGAPTEVRPTKGGYHIKRDETNEEFAQISQTISDSFEYSMLTFNPTFAQRIGGYPLGTVLVASDLNIWVRSTKDDNMDNFVTTPSFIGTSWEQTDQNLWIVDPTTKEKQYIQDTTQTIVNASIVTTNSIEVSSQSTINSYDILTTQIQYNSPWEIAFIFDNQHHVDTGHFCISNTALATEGRIEFALSDYSTAFNNLIRDLGQSQHWGIDVTKQVGWISVLSHSDSTQLIAANNGTANTVKVSYNDGSQIKYIDASIMDDITIQSIFSLTSIQQIADHTHQVSVYDPNSYFNHVSTGPLACANRTLSLGRDISTSGNNQPISMHCDVYCVGWIYIRVLKNTEYLLHAQDQKVIKIQPNKPLITSSSDVNPNSVAVTVLSVPFAIDGHREPLVPTPDPDKPISFTKGFNDHLQESVDSSTMTLTRAIMNTYFYTLHGAAVDMQLNYQWRWNNEIVYFEGSRAWCEWRNRWIQSTIDNNVTNPEDQSLWSLGAWKDDTVEFATWHGGKNNIIPSTVYNNLNGDKLITAKTSSSFQTDSYIDNSVVVTTDTIRKSLIGSIQIHLASEDHNGWYNLSNPSSATNGYRIFSKSRYGASMAYLASQIPQIRETSTSYDVPCMFNNAGKASYMALNCNAINQTVGYNNNGVASEFTLGILQSTSFVSEYNLGATQIGAHTHTCSYQNNTVDAEGQKNGYLSPNIFTLQDTPVTYTTGVSDPSHKGVGSSPISANVPTINLGNVFIFLGL